MNLIYDSYINQRILPPASKGVLAQLLGVSRSLLYYTYRLDAKDKQLADEMERIHTQDDTLGSKSLSVLLGISRIRAKRIMLKYGIVPRRKKPKYQLGGRSDERFNNLLFDKQFIENYEVIFSDIFQLKLADGTRVYCCFAIRKKTRQIISFCYSLSMESELVVSTLEHIDLYDLTETEVIWHSDQGSQYGSETTIDTLIQLSFIASMSRAGTPTDNPIAERFVRTFKFAVVERYSFANLEMFSQAAQEWLNFYNQQKPHQSLGMKSPNQFATDNNLANVSFIAVVFV